MVEPDSAAHSPPEVAVSTMPVCVPSLLRHLSRHGYLAPVSGSEGPAPGPLGRLLLRNLTALWRRDVELGLGVAVVPAELPPGLAGQAPPLADAVSELISTRRCLRLSPPFGLCSEHPVTSQLTAPRQLITPGDSQLTAPSADHGRLTLLLAVPPESSADWFQTLQRRRRIWWRELAADPGNYSLEQRSADGAQVLFDGRLVVERLRSHGRQEIDGDGGDTSRRECHLLSSEVSLESGLLAVCGDSLDGGALRLRERLAPFRRAVTTEGGGSPELRALAVHVANQLRSAGLSVFPLPASSSEGEDTPRCSEETAGQARPDHAAVTDGAGVPFTVLLSESTLLDGVCRLRSRDTTLSHQVHVSQLTDVT